MSETAQRKRRRSDRADIARRAEILRREVPQATDILAFRMSQSEQLRPDDERAMDTIIAAAQAEIWKRHLAAKRGEKSGGV